MCVALLCFLSSQGKYVVLVFYPLDHTFVCPTEICQFNDRSKEFEALNTQVLLCSVDSKFCHLSFSNVARKEGGIGPIQVPMLADITKKIARDYGVLLEDGEDAGVALRGLFIIDDKGILRQITVNDLPVGRSIDEALRLVTAFKHTDEHGVVCPAGWTEGAPTMVDDVAESKKYFSTGATEPITGK